MGCLQTTPLAPTQHVKEVLENWEEIVHVEKLIFVKRVVGIFLDPHMLISLHIL